MGFVVVYVCVWYVGFHRHQVVQVPDVIFCWLYSHCIFFIFGVFVLWDGVLVISVCGLLIVWRVLV